MRLPSLALSSLLLLAGLAIFAIACGGADQQGRVSTEQGRPAGRVVVLDRWEPVIMEMEEIERLVGFRPLQLADEEGGFLLEERIASPEEPVVSMTYTRGEGRDSLAIVQWKMVPGEPLKPFQIEGLRGELVAVDGGAGRYIPAEPEVRPFHALVLEREGIAIRIVASPLTIPRELLVDIAASLA